MQRVLSFQMARGIDESNEFVTKRVCFSFMFSIGFLMLLGGFLIGRYAAGRSVEMRAEKMKLNFIGNGLEKSEFMRHELIQHLKENEFETEFYAPTMAKGKILESVETALSGLSIFDKVTGNDSCVVALARGAQEADRYVALAATDNNIDVGLAIAKEFNKISKNHDWRPQRTLIFIMSTNSMESCLYSVSNYERSKIIAYLAIDKNPINENGFFITAGSDMVSTTVAATASDYFNFLMSPNDSETIPKMAINIPHTIISFHSGKNNSYIVKSADNNKDLALWHRRSVTQVMSDSLWRLSEMTIFQWDPQLLNAVDDVLNNELNLPNFEKVKGKIQASIKRIIARGEELNTQIEQIDRLKSLNVRMMNDYLKDLEYALLCPDKNFHSKTDVAIFVQLLQNNNNIDINDYLYNMLKCYENVEEILNDMTT
ncbi:hypothetical protein PV326_004715 [Microctonus aethiopoides]|uniref:Uncharacterized protein n=1 Tax=Microctonus aethiopoides TaxID=144406 RepID=A0AA39KJQ1_9HYME|nr:hypothetical protein PV326_004715 [Microctonus aethiopoides]KAK0164035.1 hypothetical protein PV328_002705 [Microctonus aethiopoides]